jgi:hypothetical protein
MARCARLHDRQRREKTTMRRVVVLLVSAIALAGAIASLDAQRGGGVAGPAAPAVNPEVHAVANALGMVRWGDGAPGGGRENLDLLNRIEFTASGTAWEPTAGNAAWSATQIKSLVFDVAYRTVSSRVETVRVVNGRDQHSIEVVHEDYAWDEDKPGIGAKRVTNMPAAVAQRRLQIALLPTAFMRAVIQAGPAATVTEVGGKKTFTVTVNGVPITGTIGADKRPEKISMPITHPVLGQTTLEATFPGGYKDFEGYEVFFPARIVHTLGGKPMLDLTVEKNLTGVYLIFPVPNVVKTSTAR